MNIFQAVYKPGMTPEEISKAVQKKQMEIIENTPFEEMVARSERESTYENTRFVIDLIFSSKLSDLNEEKQKEHPNQSLIDELRKEIFELNKKSNALYCGRYEYEEVKQMQEHYSDVWRNICYEDAGNYLQKDIKAKEQSIAEENAKSHSDNELIDQLFRERNELIRKLDHINSFSFNEIGKILTYYTHLELEQIYEKKTAGR